MFKKLLILHVFPLLIFLAQVVYPAQDQSQRVISPTAADTALAVRAAEAAEKARGTAGREEANLFLGSESQALVKILTGEIAVKAGDMENARAKIMSMTKILEAGPHRLKPVPIYVPHAVRTPTIDGRLDDIAWMEAVTLEGGYPLNSPVLVKKPNTIWQFLWDEHYLYVGVECEDTDIIAPLLKRDGPVADDDCIRICLLPDLEKGEFWELDASPTCSTFDAMAVKRSKEWGAILQTEIDMKGWRVAATTEGSPNEIMKTLPDRGYTIEMAIPFDQLPGATAGKLANPGDRLWFMLARVDRNRGSFTTYSYTPLLSSIHNIWNYGELYLIQ